MKKSTLFIILLCFSFSGFSQNADIDLLKTINLHRNEQLDPTFKFVSSSMVPISLALPAGIITYALVKKDDASRKNALMVSATMVGAAAVSTSLKYIVQRDRPYITYPEINNLSLEGSPSFPSSHTSMSFGLATSVSLAYPKWYVIAPAYLWAGSVGYSRMHLGVHYPSDVLAGAVIGAGSAYLSFRLTNWMDKQWKKYAQPALSVKEPTTTYDQLVNQRVAR